MTTWSKIYFTYRNHRGEIERRTVTPTEIEFIANPGFDYQSGWFLSGWDHDKQARRSFALSHIIVPEDSKGLRQLVLRLPKVEDD